MAAAHRFFVDDPVDDAVRLTAGETVVLVHDGDDIEVRLDHVSAVEVRGIVVARRPNASEPSLHLTLAIPILKGDRSEEVVEAVTQLGVSRIVPFVSSRSVVRSLSPAKRRRWEGIARESAETARRGRIPAIEETRNWSELLDSLPSPLLVAWENETRTHILHTPPPRSAVIGPEGGLSPEEVEAVRTRAGTLVSLGRRNLRSETAAIAAAALLLARA